jgi:hypothetical protein
LWIVSFSVLLFLLFGGTVVSLNGDEPKANTNFEQLEQRLRGMTNEQLRTLAKDGPVGAPIVVDGKLMSNAVAPTIQELMEARVKTLRRALELLQLQYHEAVVGFRRVYEVQNALTEALVEAARSREERIELLQQHCKTLENLFLIAETKFEEGAANELDALEARASLLQAQIRLQ